MRTWAPLCCPMLPSKWHVHSMFWSGATSPALSFSLLAHISKKIWREETDWHSDPLLSIPGHSTLFVGRVCCSRWKLRSKNNFFCHDLFPSSLYSLKRRCEKPPKILRHRSAWERQFNDTTFKRTLFLHCWQQKVDIVRVLFTLRTDSCQFDWFQGLMRWVKFSRTVQVIQAQPDEIRFHWCKIFECL